MSRSTAQAGHPQPAQPQHTRRSSAPAATPLERRAPATKASDVMRAPAAKVPDGSRAPAAKVPDEARARTAAALHEPRVPAVPDTLPAPRAGAFPLAEPLNRSGSPARILDVRVWPADAYTRVTIEATHPIEHTQFVVPAPERVVVDLRGLRVDGALNALVGKIRHDDPNVAGVRVGQFDAGTLRLVFDVRQPVRPQVFVLQPAGPYRHRLVVDLYPLRQTPPTALAAEQTRAARRERDATTITTDAPRREGIPASPPSLSRQKPALVQRLVTVAIDAGHGGEDPGAVGPNGTYEKTVTLQIAQRLARRLASERNLRVFLTRDDDRFVPLGERVAKARAVKADLFVSIHADAVDSPQARGSSVFVLSPNGASSVEARWLARHENGADEVGGLNLDTHNATAAQLLMQMYTEGQIRDSKRLATSVLDRLGEVGDLHRAQVEHAAFAVLKAPDIPSILVETAFISNPDEERRLNSAVHQDRIADALHAGIRRYFTDHPPRRTGPVT